MRYFWKLCQKLSKDVEINMLISYQCDILLTRLKACCCLLRHQEAIETFKEALKLKSDFIDAYKSLGQAYR